MTMLALSQQKRFLSSLIDTTFFILECTLIVSSEQNFHIAPVESFLNNVISVRFNDCKLVLITPLFDSHDYSHKYLESNLNGNSVGNVLLSLFKNQSYHRVSSDVYRFNSANCAIAAIFIPETYLTSEISAWLFDTTTPAYRPLIRKDEDSFVFICAQPSTCDKILLAPGYGNKIKYKISVSPARGKEVHVKTVSLYGKENGHPTLMLHQDYSNLSLLFPDTTFNFNGKCFRVSNPRTKTYFDVNRNSDGTLTANRGLYKIWLDEMMIKFNFTIQVFESSLSGGSGKRLQNGTLRGTVGDVMDGSADMGAFVGHTFNRHGLVGYSTTITYEWMFFITHKPRTHYTSTAIFRPLSFQVWIGFVISHTFMMSTFKILLRDKWTLKSMMNHIVASFMEHDADHYKSLNESPVRILVTFWLIFALIFSTAYRGKLVSLIAFPMSSWVPWTYEDLAYSDFRVGLHVVGKGGAADSIFSSSSNPVFKILNNKMRYYPSPTECMREALTADIACVLWKCHFEYGLHDGFTDKFGRSSFHTAYQTTYFLHDGFIWESRAVFHQHIDRVGWSILGMGVSAYWLLSDHKVVRKMRFDREKAERVNGRLRSSDVDNILIDDEGPSKLKLVQFKGLFLLYLCGIMDMRAGKDIPGTRTLALQNTKPAILIALVLLAAVPEPQRIHGRV